MPVVMSDLSLTRYLAAGVHPIVARSADQSLVVGDSHQLPDTPDPFGRADVDALILDEYDQVFRAAAPPVVQRWCGTDAWHAQRLMLVDAPWPALRLVLITVGGGQHILCHRRGSRCRSLRQRLIAGQARTNAVRIRR